VAVRAPELAGEWLGSAPLRLAELRGRAVVLDFFTYGCINCMNNIAVMRQLQAYYGDALRVIGIHSAKFDREKERAALEAAIGRLGIAYAVVDDAGHRLRDHYAVRVWPTNVLIDADGYIVQTWTGERKMEDFKSALAAQGVEPQDAHVTPTPGEGLRFPQKLLCTEAFLAVANTGAGSVWLCDYEGRVLKTYEGFSEPMGMACEGSNLYVADRGCGGVLCIDLESGMRRSVLQGLRNPSDLALAGGTLYVAEAGAHRIIAYDLQTFEPVAVWGNRFEALRDGAFEAAQLAQPSGMSLLHERLWFVDAESSALRYIEGEAVHTAIGEGLHTFGDSDDEHALLLQHPQGVVAGQYGDGCGGGRLFIADTYNNKIKAYNPDDGSMMTLLDTLHEPGGIAKKGCTLYIADTNAHAVIAFDLPTMAQRLFL